MVKETHFIPCRSNRSEIYLYPAAWLKFKRLTIPSAGEDVQQLECSHGHGEV